MGRQISIHLWNPLPSSRTTIHVFSKQLSIASNFRTYSNFDFAITVFLVTVVTPMSSCDGTAYFYLVEQHTTTRHEKEL